MDNNKECKKTNNNIKINLKEYQKVKKVLKENYIYMIRQAYKCIQQIIQYTAYYKRISALNADFGKIVTYYHNNVLNRMKQTKVYLPDYNADMFLGIILFPKDELYLNNMENEKMLMDIDSKIIKGKEKQIQIENIIFNGKCECLLNPKIKKVNNKSYNDAIDKIQFNLIKSILTKQKYIKEFKSNNFYKAINIILNSVDDEYKTKFLFTLNYYYYNTCNLPYNTYQSDELFDIAALQVDSILRKINDNILQKKLGSKLK